MGHFGWRDGLAPRGRGTSHWGNTRAEIGSSSVTANWGETEGDEGQPATLGAKLRYHGRDTTGTQVTALSYE